MVENGTDARVGGRQRPGERNVSGIFTTAQRGPRWLSYSAVTAALPFSLRILSCNVSLYAT